MKKIIFLSYYLLIYEMLFFRKKLIKLFIRDTSFCLFTPPNTSLYIAQVNMLIQDKIEIIDLHLSVIIIHKKHDLLLLYIS